MIAGQFIGAMALGAKQVFIPHMFIVLARVIAVELIGTPFMAAFAIGVYVEGSRQPVRGCLPAVAADVRAASARRIIRKNTGFGIIGQQPGDTGRCTGIEMNIGVGARAIVAGDADAGNLWQAVMHTV